MHSIGARSIPKAQRSDYLELYVLDREKSRLEKEVYATDKRRNNTQKRLNNITSRMEKLQKEIKETKESARPYGHFLPRKPLKRMSIKY
jgi:predicted  nucleic acid-binding Zn-ribbon protein